MVRLAQNNVLARAAFEALEGRQYMSADNIDWSGSGPMAPPPSQIAGVVFVDANKNGVRDAGEAGIAGVQMDLLGTNDLGIDVHRTVWTDANGEYEFIDLRPGVYQVIETQPVGYDDGVDAAGTAGGVAGNDIVTDVNLPEGTFASGYTFGEHEVPVVEPPVVQPPDGEVAVRGALTGSIEFWHSARGQRLIKSLDGGSRATELGNWLARNFPRLYASFKSDLRGRTNSDVAAYFQRVYADKSNKLEAQVMALALSCYVTKRPLAGDVASAYGFRVTRIGTAGATCAIREGMLLYRGEGTKLTVMQILKTINSDAVNGQAYGYGSVPRQMAWRLVSWINEANKVG